MLINELISKNFIPPKISASGLDALSAVQAYNLSHIPLFQGLNLLGNIPAEAIEEHPDAADLSVFKTQLEYFFLTENSTLFDAVKVFYTHNTNIIPVLNKEENYLGYLLIEDVLAELARMPLFGESAAMLTVKTPIEKYALSEVTKIVESNNGKLMGAFVSGFTDGSIEITVKFKAESLASVAETFERFGYTIVHKFFNDEKQDLLQERYGQLMKYLEL